MGLIMMKSSLPKLALLSTVATPNQQWLTKIRTGRALVKVKQNSSYPRSPARSASARSSAKVTISSLDLCFDNRFVRSLRNRLPRHMVRQGRRRKDLRLARCRELEARDRNLLNNAYQSCQYSTLHCSR